MRLYLKTMILGKLSRNNYSGPRHLYYQMLRGHDTKSTPPTQTDALITLTESINSLTEQTYNEGKTGNDEVAAYISVPIFVIFVAVGTTAFIIFICRKRRSTDDKYVCHHRKQETDNCHLYRYAPNNSCDFNSLKDEEGFKYSTDDMRKSRINPYTEIPSELVSEKCENENNTTSFALRHGRCRTVKTKANDSYDTLQDHLKLNAWKERNKTGYDHVVIDNRNKQINGADDFSQLDAEMNNVHHNQKLNCYYENNEIRSGRTSSICGQDGQSLREYVILEPDGIYIVHK